MKAKISYLVLPILLVAICAIATVAPVEACVPPKIKILSPINMIYATNSVPLTFTVDKETSWMGYVLDGNENVTILGNTTLTALSDGAHSVVVYANDTYGRMGASDVVCFSVDTTPPNITNVQQFPRNDSVLPQEEVNVNATVTDDVSGVKRVTLFYAYANSSGTWIRVVPMTNLEGDIWSGTIPGFPYGTNVTYTISAEDNVGNAITTVEMGYDIQYTIIPEFSTVVILALFATATLLAALAYKKRRNTDQKRLRYAALHP
jgi:hypothetical protein